LKPSLTKPDRPVRRANAEGKFHIVFSASRWLRSAPAWLIQKRTRIVTTASACLPTNFIIICKQIFNILPQSGRRDRPGAAVGRCSAVVFRLRLVSLTLRVSGVCFFLRCAAHVLTLAFFFYSAQWPSRQKASTSAWELQRRWGTFDRLRDGSQRADFSVVLRISRWRAHTRLKPRTRMQTMMMNGGARRTLLSSLSHMHIPHRAGFHLYHRCRIVQS